MMAVFSVEYSAESMSQLKVIDKTIVKRIIKKIESTQNAPHLFFKRLVGRPEYKLRIGDYRVIAQMEEHSKITFIRSIGHRKEVYADL